MILTQPGLALALALLLVAGAGCGGGAERQDAEAEAGEYEVAVVEEHLEPEQRLAKTTKMRLGVRNTGAEDIPNLTITVKMLGREGRDSNQAFAYRDPQPNLARPDRPIWTVDSGYPRVDGAPAEGSAVSASPRTFQFGELPAGETARVTWRMTPVKAGSYRMTYEIAGDLYGTGRITDRQGDPPRGQLATRIREAPQRLRVTGDGRVVPIGQDDRRPSRVRAERGG